MLRAIANKRAKEFYKTMYKQKASDDLVITRKT